MARSEVKSRPHHDVAYPHPLTNDPTKYQLPIPGQTKPQQPLRAVGLKWWIINVKHPSGDIQKEKIYHS